MKHRTQSEELRSTVERELQEFGLQGDAVEVLRESDREWSVSLSVAGRQFEIGCEARDGFFCFERTPGKNKDFAAQDCGRIFGAEDRLRREGLSVVRYAIDHPDFMGVTRPVI